MRFQISHLQEKNNHAYKMIYKYIQKIILKQEELHYDPSYSTVNMKVHVKGQG